MSVVARVPLNPPLTCGQDSLFVSCQAIGRDDVRLRDIVAAMPAGPHGVNLEDMLKFCRTWSIDARVVRYPAGALESVPAPAVLHVQDGHFITYLGGEAETNRFRLFDNSTGLLECDAEWFAARMKWDGVALVFTSPDQLWRFAPAAAGVGALMIGAAGIPLTRRRLARTRGGAPRPGLTLIETLLVVGILGTLFALLLPAVHQARVSASQAGCKNNLRQIALAALHHHEVHQVLPTDGGGPPSTLLDIAGAKFVPREEVTTVQTLIKSHAVGDPSASVKNQGGSFLFSTLPFAGYADVHRLRDWTAPLPLYTCPGRRSARTRVAPQSDEYGRYTGGGWAWSQSDYAVNFRTIGSFGGPTGLARITDGASNTILLGEKALNPKNYETGTWLYDSPMFFGSTLGSHRGLKPSVVRDGPDFTYVEVWGSVHPSAAAFAFADGSVRPIAYQENSAVVNSLSSPSAGD
jgi:hypothetical protein